MEREGWVGSKEEGEEDNLSGQEHQQRAEEKTVEGDVGEVLEGEGVQGERCGPKTAGPGGREGGMEIL